MGKRWMLLCCRVNVRAIPRLARRWRWGAWQAELRNGDAVLIALERGSAAVFVETCLKVVFAYAELLAAEILFARDN